MPKNRILLLTGGGHVDFGSGITAMIEEGKKREWDVYGSLYGWKGVDSENGKEQIVNLSLLTDEQLGRIPYVGCSPIFSSRTKASTDRVKSILRSHRITHVIGFGGDDTLSVDPGIPLIGWPKTMDNNHGPQSSEWDLAPGTYFDIGYPTAVQRAGKATASSQANAQTNSSVQIIIPFGRSQDFVALGAAAYGAADFMVPGEREVVFEEFYQKVQDACKKNADTYKCRPFAVVVIPEGVNKGNAAGFFAEFAPPELVEYAKNEKYGKKDDYGHKKLQPELIALMATESLLERSSMDTKKLDKITTKVLTYHLRDGPGIEIDQRMGAATGRKCVELIDEGKEGVMATVRWDGAKFTTGEVPIKDAIKERYVMGTGFYDDKRWLPTEKFEEYASKFAGHFPARRDMLHGPYKRVMPVD